MTDEISVVRYESWPGYDLPIEDFGKTRLIAWGTIKGVRFSYEKRVESEEAEPGVVPHWFIEDARLAFERAAS